MPRKSTTYTHLYKIVAALLFSIVFLSAMAQSYRPPFFADQNRNAKIAATYARLDSLFQKCAEEHHFV